MNKQAQKWRRTTIFLLIVGVFTMAVYDLAAFYFAGQDATITQVLRDNSADWPMIVVVVGILIGHIWWGGNQKPKEVA